jgi:hypothetical protein
VINTNIKIEKPAIVEIRPRKIFQIRRLHGFRETMLGM